MPTYQELKAKAEKLMAEAEQLRINEMHSVIADIKLKIKDYEISPADLGFTAASKSRSKPATKNIKIAKYRGPNGETWSGGRGRKPQWVVDALKAGKTIEDFAI